MSDAGSFELEKREIVPKNSEPAFKRKSPPSKVRPRFWENRTVPLRTKVATVVTGLAVAVAGEKMMINEFGNESFSIPSAIVEPVGLKPVGQQLVDTRIQNQKDASVTAKSTNIENAKAMAYGEAEVKKVSLAEGEFAEYVKHAKDRMGQWTNSTKLNAAEKTEYDLQIDKMTAVILGNPSFEGMKQVVRNHADDLIESANKYNIPPEIILSIGLIENGGAEHMVSPAGARGVLQVMPDLLSQKLEKRNMTMKQFNALSPEAQDKLLIEIGAENISDMYNLFDDWGLAIWAHHGGQGNVYHALRVYFDQQYDADNLPPGGWPELESTYKKIIIDAQKKGFNFFRLLNNPSVQKQVISGLSDETEFYTLKAIAANEIINQQIQEVIKAGLDRMAQKADIARHEMNIQR